MNRRRFLGWLGIAPAAASSAVAATAVPAASPSPMVEMMAADELGGWIVPEDMMPFVRALDHGCVATNKISITLSAEAEKRARRFFSEARFPWPDDGGLDMTPEQERRRAMNRRTDLSAEELHHLLEQTIGRAEDDYFARTGIGRHAFTVDALAVLVDHLMMAAGEHAEQLTRDYLQALADQMCSFETEAYAGAHQREQATAAALRTAMADLPHRRRRRSQDVRAPEVADRFQA